MIRGLTKRYSILYYAFHRHGVWIWRVGSRLHPLAAIAVGFYFHLTVWALLLAVPLSMTATTFGKEQYAVAGNLIFLIGFVLFFRVWTSLLVSFSRLGEVFFKSALKKYPKAAYEMLKHHEDALARP